MSAADDEHRLKIAPLHDVVTAATTAHLIASDLRVVCAILDEPAECFQACCAEQHWFVSRLTATQRPGTHHTSCHSASNKLTASDCGDMQQPGAQVAAAHYDHRHTADEVLLSRAVRSPCCETGHSNVIKAAKAADAARYLHELPSELHSVAEASPAHALQCFVPGLTGSGADQPVAGGNASQAECSTRPLQCTSVAMTEPGGMNWVGRPAGVDEADQSSIRGPGHSRNSSMDRRVGGLQCQVIGSPVGARPTSTLWHISIGTTLCRRSWCSCWHTTCEETQPGVPFESTSDPPGPAAASSIVGRSQVVLEMFSLC